MLEKVLSFTDWLWSYPMLFLLVGGGIIMTILLKGFNVIKLPYILNQTIGKALKAPKEEGKVTGFQALTVALSTTLGVGNIVGVALAVAYGGPGAIFWMWVIGLVACAIKYSEVVTAMRFREKDENGEWIGGPMVYLSKGTGIKWLGPLFACVAIPILAVANTVQAASVGDTMTVLGIPKIATILVIVAIVVIIVYGGITRIVSFTEKLIPFVSILYMLGGLIIIVMNAGTLPSVFVSIFEGAFSNTAATGGFAGATFAMAARWGVARGIYTNDSGNGLSSIAHCNANVKHPVQQGMMGVFEVFFDTIVVCTVTALVVLCSGVWKTMDSSLSGAMTITAFQQHLGFAGTLIVSVSTFLFALLTIIAFVYYGEKLTQPLFGTMGRKITRFAYCVILLVGGIVSLGVLVQLLDLMNAIIISINMTGIIYMFPHVMRLTKQFFSDPEKYQDLTADSDIEIKL